MYIYIYIKCILSCCHLHIFGLINNTLDHCLIARSLRLVYFLHISELRSLYTFLLLIDNTSEHCQIYRNSRLVNF